MTLKSVLYPIRRCIKCTVPIAPYHFISLSLFGPHLPSPLSPLLCLLASLSVFVTGRGRARSPNHCFVRDVCLIQALSSRLMPIQNLIAFMTFRTLLFTFGAHFVGPKSEYFQCSNIQTCARHLRLANVILFTINEIGIISTKSGLMHYHFLKNPYSIKINFKQNK